MLTFGSFGWSYTPGTIHRIYCSSQYYSLKILFIAILPLKILTLFIVFYYSYQHDFIICTNINLFIFSKFLLVKVR